MNDFACQGFTAPPFDFIHENINLIEDNVKDGPLKTPRGR